MDWTKIHEEFPEEGSYVCAKMENKKDALLCRYKNDSFGLGDDDFKIKSWRYLLPPMPQNPKRQNRNPQSTSRDEDRINADSSALLQHLV